MTKALFWRALWNADETDACAVAAAQMWDVILRMDLGQPYAARLMMVANRFVNTGDQTELDELLAEIADRA